jgi:hypothetical protein
LQRVTVLVTPGELAKIDAWGVHHAGNRGEAIRTLVSAGLRAVHQEERPGDRGQARLR